MDRMVNELDPPGHADPEANPSILVSGFPRHASGAMNVHSPVLIVLTYENPSVLHRRQIDQVVDAPIAQSLWCDQGRATCSWSARPGACTR